MSSADALSGDTYTTRVRLLTSPRLPSNMSATGIYACGVQDTDSEGWALLGRAAWDEARRAFDLELAGMRPLSSRADQLAFAAETTARLYPMFLEYWSGLQPGNHIEMRESARVVGRRRSSHPASFRTTGS